MKNLISFQIRLRDIVLIISILIIYTFFVRKYISIEVVKRNMYNIFGSIRLDYLSIFNVFMQFSNILFSKESENNDRFFYIKYV